MSEGMYETDEELMDCWDDVTGKAMNPSKVKTARRRQWDSFSKLKVYGVVRREVTFARKCWCLLFPMGELLFFIVSTIELTGHHCLNNVGSCSQSHHPEKHFFETVELFETIISFG